MVAAVRQRSEPAVSGAATAWRGERVAIAGATGFIGRIVAQRLEQLGATVTLLTHRTGTSSGRDSVIITEPSGAALADALRSRQIGHVINLAGYGVDPKARDLQTALRVNVELAALLAEAAAAAGVKSFVHVGSNSEYADQRSSQPVEETASLETGRIYGASKAAGSLMVQAVAASTGLPAVVARLFNVYGPGEAAWRLLPSLHAALRGKRRVALSPGTQVRDFLHVDDAADGLIALAAAAAMGHREPVVNLCSGQGVSVRTFAEACARAIDADGTLLGFGDLPMRPDDIAHLVGSTVKLHSATTWRPRYTLDEGLARSIRALEEGT